MKTTRVDETKENKIKRETKKVKESKSSIPFRIFAFILWIIGFAFEFCAFLSLNGKIQLFNLSTIYTIAIFLVLDCICIVIASQLWKRANHISPASKENSVLFFLQNNLGVIMSLIAFLPIIVLIFTDKKQDKKSKTIASILAIVLLAISGISSFDFNPISSEELTKAEQILQDTTVYWTPFGKVYHIDNDCPHLNKTDQGYEGTVHAAIENGKTRLCKTCAKKHNITDLTMED